MLKLFGLYQDKQFPSDFSFITEIVNDKNIKCFSFDGHDKIFKIQFFDSNYILLNYFSLFKQYDSNLSFEEFEKEMMKLQQLLIFR